MDSFERTPHPRLLPLEGGINFRDLGGYAGHGGRVVRWGSLFRSGRLNDLTDGDLAAVEALNLDFVVDFRQKAEREREPSRWGTARTHTVDIVPVSAEAFFGAALETSTEATAAFMAFIYRDFVLNQAAAYRTLFARILAQPDARFLFHCSAGKDRTGFGSALLLSALGVSRADIMADYLLTGTYLDADRELRHVLAIAPDLLRPPMTRATVRPIFEVRQTYLETAFQAMEEIAGSVEGYLDSLGVGPAARRELMGRYLA